MNKTLLIEQSLTHFTLLVDELMGSPLPFTEDINKIEYNLKQIDLMGLDVHYKNIDNETLGVSAVGRYILIFRSLDDALSQKMYFLDHLNVQSYREMNEQLRQACFSEIIIQEVESLRAALKMEFNGDEDLVELSDVF